MPRAAPVTRATLLRGCRARQPPGCGSGRGCLGQGRTRRSRAGTPRAAGTRATSAARVDGQVGVQHGVHARARRRLDVVLRCRPRTRTGSAARPAGSAASAIDRRVGLAQADVAADDLHVEQRVETGPRGRSKSQLFDSSAVLSPAERAARSMTNASWSTCSAAKIRSMQAGRRPPARRRCAAAAPPGGRRSRPALSSPVSSWCIGLSGVGPPLLEQLTEGLRRDLVGLQPRLERRPDRHGQHAAVVDDEGPDRQLGRHDGAP